MKIHFGKGIAFVYSLFALSMLAAAIRSTYYDVGLIKKDYYTDDLTYQTHFNKVQNEQSAPEHLKIERNTEGSFVVLIFPKNQTAPTGTVTLFRPSQVGIDQTLNIQTNADNTMQIPTNTLLKGVWKIKVDWIANGVGFYRESAVIF